MYNHFLNYLLLLTGGRCIRAEIYFCLRQPYKFMQKYEK
jgi:hypothetical protein